MEVQLPRLPPRTDARRHRQAPAGRHERLHDLESEQTSRLHEATIPDDQYLSFQSTAHNMRSWAEGFFGFGNGTAQGVIGIGSYNLTEGGFNDFERELGYHPGVRLAHARSRFRERAHLGKGRRDRRSRTAWRAATTRANTTRTCSVARTSSARRSTSTTTSTTSWTLALEQGFGTHKPDPNVYNTALLHAAPSRAHRPEAGTRSRVRRALPLLVDPRRVPADRSRDRAERHRWSTRRATVLPNGNLWVAGVEARAELGAFGYIYGAYSHVGGDYALTVSRAIEVLAFERRRRVRPRRRRRTTSTARTVTA